MNCPECGQQMWNYAAGEMRCANDHVFAVTDLHPVQKVIRLDLPSRRDRIGDVLIGVVTGGGLVAVAQILVHYL